MPLKICMICESEFQVYCCASNSPRDPMVRGPRAKTCSPHCSKVKYQLWLADRRYRNSFNRLREPDGTFKKKYCHPVQCRECGGLFLPKRSWEQPVFCSKDCSVKYLSSAESRAAKSRKMTKPRPNCLQCGKKCRGHRSKFCSPTCYWKQHLYPRNPCRFCGRQCREPGRKFCSLQCVFEFKKRNAQAPLDCANCGERCRRQCRFCSHVCHMEYQMAVYKAAKDLGLVRQPANKFLAVAQAVP